MPAPASFPAFDRSLLPPAQLEFGIIGDTHFIRDTEAYAVEFDSVRAWPDRARYALRQLAALACPINIHLGDVSEEPPAHRDHQTSRDEAFRYMDSLGLPLHLIPGNMDIGDKPDPTMWTAPVSRETLQWFHEKCGPSWKSIDHEECRFILINSQILNSRLSAAAEQQHWLEQELEGCPRKMRCFLFLHLPPFFVDEQEPDTGFYNSIDEPARSWLTGLMRRHCIEAVFCGHTHFRAFNRIGDTRIHVCPSPTTSRAGFYEAFSVAPPPEGGRNDPPKLGFYLARVMDVGTRLHYIRTGGRTEDVAGAAGWSELLTRTSPDLPHSPLGLYLRTPLAAEAAGALAWPSVKRQRVRDDHPFLHALELGVRHVRLPVSDLMDPMLGRRLQLLREEGVAITAVWVDSPRLDLAAELQALPWLPDTAEIQLPESIVPTDAFIDKLRAAATHFHGTVALAPLLPRERIPGRYHPRGRLGFRRSELRDLEPFLSQLEADLLQFRIVAAFDPEPPVEEQILGWEEAVSPLASVPGFDLALPLPKSEADRIGLISQAMLAAAASPGCRLFIDPFVDLDRTNDSQPGLLDRLGNPHPAFHLVRCLNSLLCKYAPHDHTPEGWRIRDGSLIGVVTSHRSLQDFLGGVPGEARLLAVDLFHALSWRGTARKLLQLPLPSDSGSPLFVVVSSSNTSADHGGE